MLYFSLPIKRIHLVIHFPLTAAIISELLSQLDTIKLF
jgi:hypothetical protein